jgi:dihydroorotate dehydrogenase (fumarate)
MLFAHGGGMDTSTSYLGLKLSHPFMAGASPLSAHLDSVKRLEDAGVAAIVLHSLFEEQITFARSGRIRHIDALDRDLATRLLPFPSSNEYPFTPDEHLAHLQAVKRAVKVPVIASLNGATSEEWLKFAVPLQDAGADALEVNFYEVITNLDMPAAEVERQLENMVLELKGVLRIPVAVKLSPFFTAIGNVARRLTRAGADGLVIFNRFYQPDIDIRTMTAEPNLELSRSSELRLRLRWLAILCGRIDASLALTGGVETPADGIKGILAGAHAVQMVSALLRHGPSYVRTMREGLAAWMEWQKIGTIDDMRGRVSLQTVEDPAIFERANYIRTLHSWNR